MSRMNVSVFQKAKEGNATCGDSYFYMEMENGFLCALADGLGSGVFAKESSQIVIDTIKDNIRHPVDELIAKSNEKLMGKRGAVLALLKVNYQTNSYSISSIGNVGMMTITGGNKKNRNIPCAGYLAGQHKKWKVIEELLEDEMNFILYTDGVSSQDLSENYFCDKDVERITKSFALKSDTIRKDDTTLIAIHYKSE